MGKLDQVAEEVARYSMWLTVKVVAHRGAGVEGEETCNCIRVLVWARWSGISPHEICKQ